VEYGMAIFVTSAAVAMAMAVQKAGAQIAWGRGNDSWDITPEAEPANATTLYNEIGRRNASVIQFVTPDVNGDIAVPQGKFAVSLTPTSHLYIKALFDNADSPTETIREGGVFIGTEYAAGLPGAQSYFIPANVTSLGQLLMLERFSKIERSIDFSVSLEFVMTL
jgi:hypothetical protein